MSKHHFTFKEAFMFGWEKTLQHAWFIFLTFIIISIISTATILNPIVYTTVITMAMLSIAATSLLITRNHAFSFADLYKPLLSPFRVLKFFLLTSLFILPFLFLVLSVALFYAGVVETSPSVTIFGFLFTIFFSVLTIFVSVCFNFFPYVVVEHEHASIKELIKMSYSLTKGNFLKIFFFLILAGILNFIGSLLFLIGLLVSVPMTVFASAYLYDRLKNN